MILLDTHIWLWWIHDDAALPWRAREAIDARMTEGIAVSAISCWEVAKLVGLGRIELPMETHDWMDMALVGSGINLIPLTPAICIASTILPGQFHRDPADQIIVATSRIHDLPLLTCDNKILRYPHVRLVEDGQIHDR